MTDDGLRADRGDAYATGKVYRPRSFERRYEMLESLDPHFASVWLAYTAGLLHREQLDVRTRLLVLTGQYTMTGSMDALADTISAAIAADVDLKEVLEAVFLCHVFAVEHALAGVEVFVDVVGEAGLLDDVKRRGLAVDAPTRGRSPEEDRKEWAAEDAQDPRLPYLLETYGWQGVNAGLRLRPGSSINVLSSLDDLDQDFADLWLYYMYGGMYDRGVLDHRTRQLCIVGDCMAVGEGYQSPRHMRAALRQGATPAEVFEVIFMSAATIGHAHIMGIAINDFVQVLDDEGRLGELVPADRIERLRKVVAARIASRQGVAELKASDGRVGS